MQSRPLLKFKSHIEGKNAEVTIYVDRIEWTREGMLGTGGKLALGAVTIGVSLLKTGISGKTQGAEMIPVKSISSVTTARDGIRFTKVRVVTSGNTIDFRVGHNEAVAIKDLIARLVLGTHPAQQNEAAPRAGHRRTAPHPPPPPPPPAPSSSGTSAASVADELRKLADLRDAGVLSDEEFAAVKAKLLG